MVRWIDVSKQFAHRSTNGFNTTGNADRSTHCAGDRKPVIAASDNEGRPSKIVVDSIVGCRTEIVQPLVAAI